MNQDIVQGLIDLISDPDLLPQKKKHYGLFYAEVVDIHDPLRLGRIKARTPHYVSFPEEIIPWAVYCSPGDGGSDNVGFYFLPPVGSTVVVSFISGDPEFPVWVGGVPGAPDDVAETHVTKLDENSPYGQAITGWDYTRFNSISTPSGHRIVLDDNRIYDEDNLVEYNARRVLIESSEGHFFRIIESKNVDADPDQLNALFELGTVRRDRAWTRRLAFDNDAETITLTGPDAVDDKVHEIEISSVQDYIRARTSRAYTLLLNDETEIAELYTTLQDEETPAHLLRFDNPDERITLKTYSDEFSAMGWDTPFGYFAITSPWSPDHASRLANVSIEKPYGRQGDPVVVISAGSDGVSSNGLFADSGSNGRPQSVKLYGKTEAGNSNNAPLSVLDMIELVTDAKTSSRETGEILIGRPSANHKIQLLPLSNKIVVDSTGQFLLYAANTISLTTLGSTTLSSPGGATLSTGATLTLEATTINMVGSQVHNYFSHYHEVRIGDPHPVAGQPSGLYVWLAPNIAFDVYHGSAATWGIPSGPGHDPFNQLMTRKPLPE